MVSEVHARHSLKAQITAATLTLFLVSMWSLAFYASEMLRMDMERVLGEQQLSTVTLLADEVNSDLKDRLHALERVAGSLTPALQAGPAALQASLANSPLLHDQFNEGVFVFDLDGTVIADFPLSAGRLGTSYKERDVAVAALRDGKTTLGQPVPGNMSKESLMAMATPIRDEKGNVIGALAGMINLAKPNFLDAITQGRYGKTGGYLIVTPSFKLMVTATNTNRVLEFLPASQDNSPWADQFVQGYEGSSVMDNAAGVEVLASVKRIPVAGWMMAAELPTTEAFAPIRLMQQRMLLATVFLMLLAGMLIWWLLRRQLAPILAVTEQLDHMNGHTRPKLYLDNNAQDEINHLIGGFNRMLATLDQHREKLKLSEAFSRTIMDSIDAEIAVLDSDGFVVAVNAPWRRFGLENGPVPGQLTPHTQVGANYLAVCQASAGTSPDDTALNASWGIQSVLKGRSPGFTLEYACHSPTQQRWFSMNVTPLGADGQGVVVVHTNITQRKQAEDALMLTRISIEVASDARFWVARSGRIFDVNASACRMLGYTRDELLQLSVTDIDSYVHDNLPRWQRHFAGVRQAGSKKFESEHITRDGKQIPVEIFANHIRFGNEDIYCAFVRDITHRKETEAALVAAKAEAEKANLAKSRFLAAASHDLRQPLSALSLYVGVLKRRVIPENNDLVLRIQDCVNSLTELLTHLLDVSKLEAGVVTPKLSDFAVDDMLTSLLTIYEAEAMLKGLRLRVRCSGAVARTDPQQFQRIIGNLLANAIRYTDRGGVLMACRRHEGKLWVEVWDTGKGIPAEKTELIFEEFTQLGNEPQRQGSGLGLAIVAKTAALLGLQIRVRSRLGRGSVFAIELPIGRGARGATEQQAALSATRSLRIGLVDDDTQMLQALVLALQTSGHRVIWATTAKEFIERLGQEAPDIVISDYRLGDTATGYDVIEAARAVFGAQLPAIIITGDTDPAVIRSMDERGIPIQFKPLQLDSLQALIRQVTERRST
ncbi:MAG: PAS domain S-box protein [Pseudomonadota bacterium]